MATLWRVLPELTPYDAAMAEMLAVRQQIIDGAAREQVWVLQSPAGYSRGKQSDADDDRGTRGLKVDTAPRQHLGGYWYHGPGVVGVVALLDFRRRLRSVPEIVAGVTDWVAHGVQLLGANAQPAQDTSGVWVGGKKVAAVALNLQSWVSAYGAGINVDPDPNAFAKIRPCRADPCEVTSLRQLGTVATFDEVAAALREAFHWGLGWTTDAS